MSKSLRFLAFFFVMMLTVSTNVLGQESVRMKRGFSSQKGQKTSLFKGKEMLPERGSKVAHPFNRVSSGEKYIPQFNTGDGTTLYGELLYSDLWNVDDASVLKYGVYSFPAGKIEAIKEEHLHTELAANGGGAYMKGNLYFTSYFEGPESLWTLYFCSLDVNTGKLIDIPLPLDTYSSIAMDMAYDSMDDKLYAVTYNDDAETFSLSTMNVETGRSTAIAPIDRMSFIAVDIIGQMYGVRYSDGMFCKIDKTTATLTEVGLTGVNCIYLGGGTFDYKSGKLYWTTTIRNAEESSALYEINTTTGKATLISYMPNNELFGCLYIPSDEDICNLKEVEDFKAVYAGTSTLGTISLKAPSTDIEGKALTGDVTVFVYDNGTLLFSKSTTPGGVISQEQILKEGLHKLEAVATNKVGKSPKKALSVYIGTDGPAAVGNLTLTKQGETTAILTWDTPTEGAHGGEIRPNQVYYTIRRFPGNELIAEDYEGNSYTEELTGLLRYYTYTVTGYYRNVEGATAVSNRVPFGNPLDIPYSESFDTFDAFKTFLIYNANQDQSTWGYYSKEQAAGYIYNTFNDGDDWLVTPALTLGTRNTYKLTFKAKSYSAMYPEELEVKLSNTIDLESFITTLIEPTILKHEDYRVYEAVIDVPEDGIYYVGFHAITVHGQYILYIDDIDITNGPSIYSPGLVTDLKATQQPNAALEVEISFKAPTTTFNGEQLNEISNIKLYRNADLIQTFTNPAPGSELSFMDKKPEQGFNTYKIICENSYSEGNPIEIKAFAGTDIPNPVRNQIHLFENNQTIIKWEAPEEGVNGGTLNYNTLTYTVTRNDGATIAENIKETQIIDNTIDTSKGQVNAYYKITAKTETGTSDVALTGFITYGEPYKDGYHESFDGGTQTKPWITTLIKGNKTHWGIMSTGDFPATAPQDNDGGLATFHKAPTGDIERLISPKINVSGMKNPKLSIWFYHYLNPDFETGYSNPDDQMQFEVYVNGEYKELLEYPIRLIDGNGWKEYEILIKDAVGNDDFQIVLKGLGGYGYNMHIDNISVIDAKDYDLTVMTLTGPEKMSVGTSRNFRSVIKNIGSKDANNYKVSLLRDGTIIDEYVANKTLAFAKKDTASFTVETSIMDAGKTYTYSTKIEFEADQDKSNNISPLSLMTEIPAPTYPTVTTLAAKYQDGKIVLNWEEPNSPEGNLVTEGFENMEAFTITDFKDWTVVDVDKMATFGITSEDSETGIYEYPNACDPMAFQIMNPSAAGITSDLWIPYTGEQMAVCFAAESGANNDWLISPKISGGQTITFYAKSVVSYYGYESFYFCYSTTDNDYQSFKKLGNIQRPSDKWTKYEFQLPLNAKYFAINCVSENTYALFIDDITYENSTPQLLELQGYNIYRDTQKQNSQVIEDNTFTDSNIQEGKSYTYNANVVYDKGESVLSAPVTVIATGINNEEILPIISVVGKTVYIKSVFGKNVSVFSTNGTVYYDNNVEDNAQVTLPQGIYMVRIDNTITKIVIK